MALGTEAPFNGVTKIVVSGALGIMDSMYTLTVDPDSLEVEYVDPAQAAVIAVIIGEVIAYAASTPATVDIMYADLDALTRSRVDLSAVMINGHRELRQRRRVVGVAELPGDAHRGGRRQHDRSHERVLRPRVTEGSCESVEPVSRPHALVHPRPGCARRWRLPARARILSVRESTRTGFAASAGVRGPRQCAVGGLLGDNASPGRGVSDVHHGGRPLCHEVRLRIK